MQKCHLFDDDIWVPLKKKSEQRWLNQSNDGRMPILVQKIAEPIGWKSIANSSSWTKVRDQKVRQLSTLKSSSKRHRKIQRRSMIWDKVGFFGNKHCPHAGGAHICHLPQLGTKSAGSQMVGWESDNGSQKRECPWAEQHSHWQTTRRGEGLQINTVPLSQMMPATFLLKC